MLTRPAAFLRLVCSLWHFNDPNNYDIIFLLGDRGLYRTQITRSTGACASSRQTIITARVDLKLYRCQEGSLSVHLQTLDVGAQLVQFLINAFVPTLDLADVSDA